jgi:uncharacterized protein YbjT (DUF2867 family)
MPKLSIIGATGELGRVVVRHFLQKGQPLKALVRNAAKATDLQSKGVETVVGDLTDVASIKTALQDVDIVVTAAHGMLGKGKNSSAKIDDEAHRHLIDAAVAAGVKQFIYLSAYGAAPNSPIDFFRTKYKIEQYLIKSGLTYTILRPAAFMEWHMHNTLGDAIIRKGKAFILGKGENKTNFIAAEDVAQVIVTAIKNPLFYNKQIELAGPENLTKKEVANLYFKHLGKAPNIMTIPRGVLKTASFVALPFHPGVARILKVSYVGDTGDATMDLGMTAYRFGILPKKPEDFVKEKIQQYNAQR